VAFSSTSFRNKQLIESLLRRGQMLRKNLISQVERENDLIKDKHLECYDREHQKVKTDGMGYNKEIFLMPKEIFITF
jgi:hypothetical protein